MHSCAVTLKFDWSISLGCNSIALRVSLPKAVALIACRLWSIAFVMFFEEPMSTGPLIAHRASFNSLYFYLTIGFTDACTDTGTKFVAYLSLLTLNDNIPLEIWWNLRLIQTLFINCHFVIHNRSTNIHFMLK